MTSVIILHLVNIFNIAASLKSNQTKKKELGGKCGAYKVSLEKPEEKNTTWKVPRPRLEDNIRMDLKSVGKECTGLMWLVVGASDGLLLTRQ